jgi:uncharacterized protein (TIGR00297 family)
MTSATAVALALAGVGAAIVVVSRQGTRTGAVAGLVVAALSILGLGPGTLLPLAVFVLGGGALTRLGRSRKQATGAAEANQGRRGVSHVVAKLGVPALLGIAGMMLDGGRALSLAYASAIAAAFADTTATEVGPLAPGGAVALRGVSLRRVPHGTPGGISLAGLAASALAAAAVAGSAAASCLITGRDAWCVAAGAGFGAACLESVVAATPPGRWLGHFGRNAMVSVVAAAVGLWAGRG